MKNKNFRMPMNIQFFAEPGDPTQQNQPPAAQTPPTQQGQPPAAAPQFDYEKLAGIIQGKQTVTEDTVLKNYFKQQGLSQEEMTAAITAFKQQRASSQPNVQELQKDTQKYQQELRNTQVINKTMLMSSELGIDIKSVPYVAKLADLSQVFGEDGTINEENLKTSINKVLEDVPGFKISTENQQQPGFTQIGGSGQQHQNNQEDLLKGIFGIKK